VKTACRQIFGGAFLPHYTLHWKGPAPDPELRMAEDLNGIYARRGCRASGPIYAMFRDLAQNPADRWWMKQNCLRYDVTVIPPRKLCGEYVKTKGHYHPLNENRCGYPEIYAVLNGKAHYLLQREDLTDAVLVEAGKGDVVVVPPGYGHVTINPLQDEVLEMANIVSSRFSSNYAGYEEHRGALYYEMDTGEFRKNRAYDRHPHLRFVQARRIHERAALLPGPLYDLIGKRAPVLEFLNFPEQYQSRFAGLYP